MNEPNETTEQTQSFRDRSTDSILAELAFDETLKGPGCQCEYPLLQERLGKDPQREAYPFIATARRRFERKHNCVLAAIPNKGIKWLTPQEVVVNRWDHDIGHLRRHSRSTLKRQKTTIGATLPPEIQKRSFQNLAFAGVLAHMSKPKTERQIAEAADKSGKILSAGEALKHFNKPDGKDLS